MTALDLIAADPSLLLRAALDQIRALQLETDRQQATILAQREELRRVMGERGDE